MITFNNRHTVTNTLQRLLSAAEYFSAFEMAKSASSFETAVELRGWAEIKASEFDEQFKVLAMVLGYSVGKIGVAGGEDQLRDALRSISKNTCCDGCQEAALVALEALGGRSDA